MDGPAITAARSHVSGRAAGLRRLAFKHWPAFCLLPFTFCLLLLAYQAPLSLTLPIGGDLELRRRDDDAPFLRGRNGTTPAGHGSEPADVLPDPDNPGATILWYEYLARSGGRPYRWTTDDTMFTVPGVGGGAWQLELLAGGQPTGAPTPSNWRLGDGPTLAVELPPGEPRRYRLLLPATASGDLRLHMATPPFAPPGDPRVLGIVLYEAQVSPLGSGPRAPAWPQIGWVALCVAGLYLAGRGLALGPRVSLALGVGAAVAAALAAALARPALTFFTPTLAGLALLLTLIAAVGHALTRPLAARDAEAATFARRVIALTALALALRLGGMWHPHALYSDSGLHANKLYALALGQVFQSAELPAESGGGQAPYPTGPYLLIAPGLLLIPAGRGLRVELMQAGAALLDSLTIPLIALIALRAGLGRPAALLGAAAYLLPITALESFAVGELANIAGQAMAMPFIALLALGWASGEQEEGAGRAARFVAPLAALCAGLLAHSGVTLSLGAWTAAAWGLALWGRVRGRPGPVDPLRLGLIGLAALALTVLCYYSAPPYLETLLDRVGGQDEAAAITTSAEASRPGVPALDILRDTALTALGLAPPRSRAWALPVALCLTALGGLALIWARRQPAAAGLRLVLGAWWLGALLTQGLLLIADQGLRWTMFLYPALCLSAGALLGELWGRGRAGKAAAGLILAATLGYGLFMWISQVRDYYHV